MINFATIPRFHLNFKDEVIEIYSSRMIRAFAYSLIGIFIPIYLLNIGFSLQQVMLFLMVKYLVVAAMGVLSEFIQKEVGIKHTIVFSTLFLVSFFYLLYTIGEFHWSIFLLSFFSGADVALYWVPLNINFATNIKKNKAGEQTGALIAIPKIAAITAPLIGALIIDYFSFNFLTVIAGFLIIASAFPLFLTKDKKYKTLSISSLFTRHNKKYSLIFFSKGVLSAVNMLWPLFIYFTVQDYLFVGSLSTLQALAGLVIVLIIGKITDKQNQVQLFKKAAFLNGLLWLFILFISSPFAVSIASFFIGMGFAFVSIPSFAFVCSDSYHDHMAELMVYREILISLGRVLVFSLFFLLPYQSTFKLIFFIGAFFSFSFLLFKK